MFAEIVAGTPIVVFPVVGLVLFFGLMLGVYIWTFNSSRRSELDKLRYIPLE